MEKQQNQNVKVHDLKVRHFSLY